MINSFSENGADTQRQQKSVQGHKYQIKLCISGRSTKFTSLFGHASELTKKGKMNSKWKHHRQFFVFEEANVSHFLLSTTVSK